MRRGRDKRLSEAEIALWRQVVRQVQPLRGRAALEPEPVVAAPPPVAIPEPPPAIRAPEVKKPPAPPPLAPLERRLRQQLRRGSASVDAVIDLHGLRQDEAHAALRAFLHREQARGSRLALVVTGKGAIGELHHGEGRGILRRNVPHWLRLADLRPLVVGFEEAELRHGGAGALYIRLRRRREDER